jgi:hypothetical protein
MSTTTFHPSLNLATMPERIKRLPVDERGYPCPWFIAWDNGKPEFRAMDGQKFIRAVRDKLCWVCGEALGRWKTFTLGPMCGISRTTSEPPSHLECARWSCENCPFLSNPEMVRREDHEGKVTTDQCAGIAIMRNPGVSLLWVTRDYTVFPDPNGRPLICVGEPVEVEWYCRGRKATRAEIEHSIETGLPTLLAAARMDGAEAVTQLMKQRRDIDALLPAA